MGAWMQRDIVRQNGSKKALPTISGQGCMKMC